MKSRLPGSAVRPIGTDAAATAERETGAASPLGPRIERTRFPAQSRRKRKGSARASGDRKNEKTRWLDQDAALIVTGAVPSSAGRIDESVHRNVEHARLLDEPLIPGLPSHRSSLQFRPFRGAISGLVGFGMTPLGQRRNGRQRTGRAASSARCSIRVTSTLRKRTSVLLAPSQSSRNAVSVKRGSTH